MSTDGAQYFELASSLFQKCEESSPQCQWTTFSDLSIQSKFEVFLHADLQFNNQVFSTMKLLPKIISIFSGCVIWFKKTLKDKSQVETNSPWKNALRLDQHNHETGQFKNIRNRCYAQNFLRKGFPATFYFL